MREAIQLVLSGLAKHNNVTAIVMPSKIKHGFARRGKPFPKTYRVWRIMLRRCNDQKLARFKDYGGRGIKVCERWLEFLNFLADMGECPDGHSINRKDNNGDYCPENCEWASLVAQANNKRTNFFVALRGASASVASHCRHFGIKNYATVLYRLHLGWTPERAFFTPPGPTGRRLRAACHE